MPLDSLMQQEGASRPCCQNKEERRTTSTRYDILYRSSEYLWYLYWYVHTFYIPLPVLVPLSARTPKLTPKSDPRICRTQDTTPIFLTKADQVVRLSGLTGKEVKMMLSKHAKPAHATARVLSAVSFNGGLARNPSQSHQLQQNRTILGLVPFVDKRLYRLARGVMPPISKTEQIALGCGTIGKSYVQNSLATICVCWQIS